MASEKGRVGVEGGGVLECRMCSSSSGDRHDLCGFTGVPARA